MAEAGDRRRPAPLAPPGLCATCRHAQQIASPRSTFLRCARAERDPAFPRYPTLPVFVCRGFEATPVPRGSGAPGAGS